MDVPKVLGEDGKTKTERVPVYNNDYIFVYDTPDADGMAKRIVLYSLSQKKELETYTEVGYTKFSELAQHAMEILRYSEQMRDDCKMIFLTHSENVGDAMNPKYVIKTVGKLLAEKVTLEGLFTYIFFTKVSEGDDGKMQYKLLTNSDGTCIAKTSFGMFDDMEIDNDLAEIIKVIDAYNEGE